MKFIFFILIGTLFIHTELFSQMDTITTDEIVVTARRVQIPYSEASRTILILDKSEIQKLHYHSIDDVLQFVPGVDLRQRGAFGVQSDISIRGGGFDQTLVMINGIPVNDPQTGHHNLNIPVGADDIDRIEILSGSGSRILGANAFSGAINILTGHNHNNNFGKASIGIGEHGLFESKVSAAYNFSELKNYFSITKRLSNGYMENTDFDIMNAFYGGTLNSPFGTVDFQTGYNAKSFGANSFYSAKYPEQFEETSTFFSSVNFNTGEKFRINGGCFYRMNKDKFVLFRYKPEIYTNYHLTEIFGAKFNSIMFYNNHSTAFGIELRNENILSNRLGEPISPPVKVSGIEGYYDKEAIRTNASFFIEQNFDIGDLDISGGLMMNYNTAYRWNNNYGLDLSYKIEQQTIIFATINKAMRIPTFTDIYYLGPDIIGNSELVPEEALSYETGLKYEGAFFSGAISVFYRNSNNIIDWVYQYIDTSYKWRAENITRLNTAGIDFLLNFDLSKILKTNLNAKFSFGYSYIDLVKGTLLNNEGDILQTKYSLDFLKHKVLMTGTFNITKNLTLNLIISYNKRAGTFMDLDEKMTPYPDFFLLDASINYQIERFLFYIKGSNLLNSEYFDISNLRQPGTWIMGGIEYLLEFN